MWTELLAGLAHRGAQDRGQHGDTSCQVPGCQTLSLTHSSVTVVQGKGVGTSQRGCPTPQGAGASGSGEKE